MEKAKSKVAQKSKKLDAEPAKIVEIKRKVDGQIRHFYGETKKKAEKKYQEALVAAATQKENSTKFEVVAEEWWIDYQNIVKPGTLRAYRGCYSNALKEFSGYQMKEITPGLVNTWGLKFRAQNMASGTARNARSVLSLIFKYWCVRDGETYNPVPLVDLPRGMKRTERQPPTPAQLAAVKAHPEGFGLCAWLFMYTGCRLGEVVALQWQDVDFDAGQIHITKSATWVNNQPMITTPKTKNGVRNVPILSPLLPVLQSRKGKPEEYVVSGANPLTDRGYRHAWEIYCRDLGMVRVETVQKVLRGSKVNCHVYHPTVTAHQFRHEMASAMYEAGLGELEAQKILGHADISTTRKIYTHLREAQLDLAAQKLDAFFRSGMGRNA